MSEHEDRLVGRVAEAIWDSEQRRVQDDYSTNGVFELVVTRWDEAGERNQQWMRGIARAAIEAVRAQDDRLEAPDDVPDTSRYQTYDPETEEVYPRGQVADLVASHRRLCEAITEALAALREGRADVA